MTSVLHSTKDVYTVLNHLKESVEIEYCSPRFVGEVMAWAGKKLAETYESEYERLKIKESFLYKFLGQPF
jgi:hypothetical protein